MVYEQHNSRKIPKAVSVGVRVTSQLIFPNIPGNPERANHLESLFPLDAYTQIIILYSGGKDSLAVLLYLLELGVSPNRMLLFHHDIDGGHPTLPMDWPCTQSYVAATAEHFQIELVTSWRQHGFWGEVARTGASLPVFFTQPDGIYMCPQTEAQQRSAFLRSLPQTEEVQAELAKLGYRRKLPAKGSIVSGRWCSAALKGMVGDSLIRCMPQFNTGAERLLIISGERRHESNARRALNEMEKHRTHAVARGGRLVHHWRPIIDWAEEDVWAILERHSILPHPCYFAGWNRCSCAMCIFGLPRHWAGIRELLPGWYNAFCQQEQQLGHTLNVNRAGKEYLPQPLEHYVGNAQSCVCHLHLHFLDMLRDECAFTGQSLHTPSWFLPAGAYTGAAGGPC